MESMVQSEIPPLTPGGASMTAEAISMVVIASIWVVLRIWARRLQNVSPLLTEDIYCYLALLSYYAVGVISVCMAVVGGAGYHMRQLQRYQAQRFYKTVFIGQILYALSLGFVKISIARNFQRIFFTRKFRIVAQIVIAFQVAWVLQTIFIAIFICRPVERNWDPYAQGTCGNETFAYTSVSVVDIIMDIVLLLLPVRPLMALRIKKADKIALALIFSGGFITVIITAVRLYLTYSIDFSDYSYSVVRPMHLNIIQPGIAIMVACSPLLRPILDRILGRPLGSQKQKPGVDSSQHRWRSKFSLPFVPRGGWSKLPFSRSSRADFDQGPAIEQQAQIQLGIICDHEVHISVYDHNHNGPNGKVLPMHQTVVSSRNGV